MSKNGVEVIISTDFKAIGNLRRGKVRDIYDLGARLIIVATDRISAFDVVLPNGIPEKGRVLTQISEFWFEQTTDIIPNHLISTKIEDFPKNLLKYREELSGRSMLVICRSNVSCAVTYRDRDGLNIKRAGRYAEYSYRQT